MVVVAEGRGGASSSESSSEEGEVARKRGVLAAVRVARGASRTGVAGEDEGALREG